MKKILSKTAFTLIELLVSIALVSVILLGVFTISMVLSNNGLDYGQKYSLRSQTQITLDHILNDASLAVGSTGTVGSPTPVADQGIVNVSWLGAGNLNTFCIHQRNNGVTIAGSIPSTDNWVCYNYDLNTTLADYHEISYCYVQYNQNSGTPLRGATGNCGANPEQFLGTVFKITPSPPALTYSNGQLVFAISIENCLSDRTPVAAPFTQSTTCDGVGAGVSSDPVNNPEVTVSGSVSPMQHGMQQT